jgi:hypothetical protein
MQQAAFRVNYSRQFIAQILNFGFEPGENERLLLSGG